MSDSWKPAGSLGVFAVFGRGVILAAAGLLPRTGGRHVALDFALPRAEKAFGAIPVNPNDANRDRWDKSHTRQRGVCQTGSLDLGRLWLAGEIAGEGARPKRSTGESNFYDQQAPARFRSVFRPHVEWRRATTKAAAGPAAALRTASTGHIEGHDGCSPGGRAHMGGRPWSRLFAVDAGGSRVSSSGPTRFYPSVPEV